MCQLGDPGVVLAVADPILVEHQIDSVVESAGADQHITQGGGTCGVAANGLAANVGVFHQLECSTRRCKRFDDGFPRGRGWVLWCPAGHLPLSVFSP